MFLLNIGDGYNSSLVTDILETNNFEPTLINKIINSIDNIKSNEYDSTETNFGDDKKNNLSNVYNIIPQKLISFLWANLIRR